MNESIKAANPADWSVSTTSGTDELAAAVANPVSTPVMLHVNIKWKIINSFGGEIRGDESRSSEGLTLALAAAATR